MAIALFVSRTDDDGRTWYSFCDGILFKAVHEKTCPCLILHDPALSHTQPLDALTRPEAHELLDQWLDELERR